MRRLMAAFGGSAIYLTASVLLFVAILIGRSSSTGLAGAIDTAIVVSTIWLLGFLSRKGPPHE